MAEMMLCTLIKVKNNVVELLYLLGSSVDCARSGTDVDGVRWVTDVVVLSPKPTLKNGSTSLFYVTDKKQRLATFIAIHFTFLVH